MKPGDAVFICESYDGHLIPATILDYAKNENPDMLPGNCFLVQIDVSDIRRGRRRAQLGISGNILTFHESWLQEARS